MSRAALFDVDGTLVDSTFLHTLAWWQAFRRVDLDVPTWQLHRCIGVGPDHLVPAVTGNDVDIDALAESYDPIYSSHRPALRLLSGARDLVQHCHDSGLTTVLASSAGAHEVQVVRDLLDADSFLDQSTSSDDAEDSKPAPDLVTVAVRRAGVDPADLLAHFDDSIPSTPA